MSKPVCQSPFKDFIELERWLATEAAGVETDSTREEAESDEAAKYYQAVEKFVTDMGFYERLLVLQGSDKEYCIASMEMQRSGFLAGQSPKVVGALTLDSVKKYIVSRELSLLFLESLRKQFAETET